MIKCKVVYEHRECSYCVKLMEHSLKSLISVHF